MQGKKLDFDNMKWHERLRWRIKLWYMDNFSLDCNSCWRLLPSSYEYTHTPEECEAEKRRIIDEVKKILNEVEETK